MPPRIRALLTLTVILFTTFIWYIRDTIGFGASPSLLFGLVAFMCGAIWLFPEVKEKDKKGQQQS